MGLDADRTLQTDLYSGRSDAVFAAILESLPAGSQARAALLSTSSDHAGAWLNASPALPFLRLNDTAFKNSLNMRLLLPHADIPANLPSPLSCAFCHKHTDLTGNHAFSCQASNRFQTDRHTTVRDVLADIARTVPGVDVTMEPKLASYGVLPRTQQQTQTDGAPADPADAFVDTERMMLEDGRVPTAHRADILLTHNGEEIFVDLSFTHPNVGPSSSPEHPAPCSLHRLAAADKRVKSKVAMYTRHYLISETGARRLVIFAGESYGAPHKAADTLLQTLADIKYPGIGKDNTGDVDGLRAEWLCNARQHVSVALMRGNSKIVQAWKRVGLALG
jgi:hypothetical protein